MLNENFKVKHTGIQIKRPAEVNSPLSSGKLWLLIAFLFAWGLSQAQKYIDPREADNYYKDRNYLAAMKVYKELLIQKPGDIDYHFNMGMCYLNTNIDKSLAIPYFEWITKQVKFDNDVWYQLGKAYHYANRFREAIKAFGQYKIKAGGSDLTKADKEIEECTNGEELVKYPLKVSFQNLGKEVNTSFPDYYPLVNSDESMLIFTTRRPGPTSQQVEIDGYYSSDIYVSRAVNGVWGKAQSIGSQINGPYDEEAVGLNPSASELTIYIDDIKNFGKIYYSERKGNTFQKPILYNVQTINSDFQSSGSISPDGNTLFFASKRSGGYGETDIYMAKKLPNGQWALPQNLGPNINTPYKEDFPWLDVDGATLYFSSQGHTTMGDFDLFKSQWLNTDSNSWSAPQNLGYPVNTTGDDRCISFTSDHHVAYVSRVRPEGYGDMDIYRVVFNDMQRYAVVRGRIITADTTKPIEALMTVTNVKTSDQFQFKPIPRNGHYIMALPPGVYRVKIECSGYTTLNDNIIIYDLSSFQPETDKNYSLSK
ncbi:MAG: tetratricopeptide repeat protein [Bacteroidia bacterium]|nr:tetratricopeptide repeat protein [Bacteroidia bacterium]